jgi:hypothetical protein
VRSFWLDPSFSSSYKFRSARFGFAAEIKSTNDDHDTETSHCLPGSRCHYFDSQLRVHEQCQTGKRGSYAAGEIGAARQGLVVLNQDQRRHPHGKR